MSDSAKPVFMNRTLGEWLFSLPIFILLLLTLVIGTGEMFHGQLLRTGEKLFGDQQAGVQYFLLRADPTKPACDPNADLESEVQKQIAAQQSGGDDLGDLFGETVIDEAAVRQSVAQNLVQCKEKHELYGKIQSHITPAVKAYRTVETGFFAIFRFGTENRPLILLLMVLIAAIHTTLGEHHIALRPPKTRKDFRVYAVAMTVGNAIITASCVYYLKLQQQSGVAIDKPVIYYLWIGLFAALTLISARQLIRLPARAEPGGSLRDAFLSIPLFAFMAVVAGLNFIAQGHWAGLAIYLNQMMELSGVFLNLALYIWSGMLLKQTRVVDNFLDILRPWKLSPEFLTYIILLMAALPTAYTGASGIFVIAAGAIIYHEVKYAGGRRQFALAATAMSGSLGVVLAPCLLVVVIAALNKQVTTAELYGWGFWVFLLSSTMFLVASQVVRRQKVDIEKVSVALPASFRAFGPVAPYIVIAVGVAMFYGSENYGLNTKLNEFTAPVILPVIMLAIVIFDKFRRQAPKEQVVPAVEGVDRRIGLEGAVRLATNETIAHIGALIILMALSTCTGGVIERSGIMESVPHSFGNVWMAMGLLVALLVFIGMIMDPFGAVILVSATIAPVAYNNGINPIHFWMVVLTAFELGYLSPPVALNQLLARQVVGEEEMEDADREAANEKSFYYRYERWVLPVIIMATTLMLVAFGPLVYTQFFQK